MFPKILTLLALVISGTLSIASPSDIPSLAPVRRRSDLVARGVVAGLKLQPEVTISFAKDRSPGQTHVSVADVWFRAHKGIPILLLEDFEKLTLSISCSGDSISITFTGHAHCNFARNEWTQYNSFVLISNHYSAGCNVEKERGAFLVRGVKCGDSGVTCVLEAEVIEWRQVGETMSVSFNQIPPEVFDEDLVCIETSNSDPKLDISSLDNALPGKTKLWPLLGGVFDQNPGLEVNCIDCSVRGNLVVSGRFSINSAGISTAFVEVKNTKAINATLGLEFAFNQTGPVGKEFPVSLVSRIILSYWGIPGIFSIEPYYEFNLLLALSESLVEKQLHFTFGTTMEVPADSVARFDMANTSNSFSHGWDKTRVEKIPLRLSKFPEPFNFGLNTTLSPAVGFEVTFLWGYSKGSVDASGFTASPSISFAVPKFTITGEFLKNVRPDCTALTITDFNYYPRALQLSLTLEFGASASLTAGASLPRIPSFAKDISVEIFSVAGPTLEDCLVFPPGRAAGEMASAHATQPEIDVPKVQEYMKAHGGEIPTGVNATQLALITGVPSGGRRVPNGDGLGVGPGWLGLVEAFLAGIALMLV